MSPKPVQNQSFLNRIDIMTIILGCPTGIWLIGLIPGLSQQEKMGGFMVFMTIILGIEMLIKSLFSKQKKVRQKKRSFLRSDEIHLFDLFKITPNLFVNFIVAFTSGGIIGYLYLEQHPLIFVASGLTFFIMLIGIELTLGDSFTLHERLLFSQMGVHLLHYAKKSIKNAIVVSTLIGSVVGVLICVTLYSSALQDIVGVTSLFFTMSLGTSMVFTQMG